MDGNRGKLFTIGEFAAKAGVTQRTIRFYDTIGLLKPCAYGTAGKRMYSRQDFAKLQKILTLKYIGLSLDEIEKTMKHEINDADFKKSLEIQRDILDKKVQYMHMVVNAIDETLHMVDNENDLNWDKFINIIKLLNIDRDWLEQYQNSSNLRARIRLHELYSTNQYGWMRWYFEQFEIPQDARILELGCGDGSLWAKNIDRIPQGCDITLTDFSQGMLKDAKKELGRLSHRFKFQVVDAQSIPFDDESFDVVMANHMLYHVPDIDRAFSEIHRVLGKDGYFYASTIGKNHMAQLRDIAQRFKQEDLTIRSFDITEKFQLENGLDKVGQWFKQVGLKRYEDSLIVTDAGPLIDYIFSMPGNARETFDDTKLEQLIAFIDDEIKKHQGIYITKDTDS